MNREQQEKKVYAYTPGLKVKKSVIVRKSRMLPLSGDILVEEGDNVDFDTVVARTFSPGDPEIINAAAKLSVTKDLLSQYLLKKEGDFVEKDDIIAKNVYLFGLIKRMIYAPFDGTIESVSDISGRIVFRGKPIPVEVNAYIPGKVVKIISNQGVIIETKASFIQGIFGVGGETFGEIHVLEDSKNSLMTEDHISQEYKGKILIGGVSATIGAIKKAIHMGVSGLVTGGMRSEELEELIGYDIGVAITGEEDISITLIATESFGEMPIADHTFNLLKALEGEIASINGATQIRAGVMRPEIIVPNPGVYEKTISEADLDSGMMPGTRIRAIRAPYFGKLGYVKSLPVKLQKLETESYARVVEIEFDDEVSAILPRANVELIVE